MKNKKQGGPPGFPFAFDYLQKTAWAIVPEVLEKMCHIIDRRMGGSVNVSEIESSLGVKLENSYSPERSGFVAIIPIHGVISKKMNLFSRISGGTSCELVKRDIRAALDDDDVAEIHLNVDSPGGAVDGTKSLADFIYESRGKKPIKAFIDGQGCSAAYWIASAADKVIATDTSMVGSIGVITAHVDYSQRYKDMGVVKTYIYSGKYKAIANEAKPLSDEGEAYIQDRLDKYYSIFVESVARNRGVDFQVAMEEMADAKVFIGEDALSAGLIDAIGEHDEYLGETEEEGCSISMSAEEGRSSEVGAFTHNSATVGDEPKWSSVDKAKLPRLTHAEMGEEGKKSTWKFPHHHVVGGTSTDDKGVYTNGTMYLHRQGVSVAWGAAHGARSGKEATATVKNHLKSHRKSLGMDAMFTMEKWKEECKEIFGDSFDATFKGWDFTNKPKTEKEESMDLKELRSEYPELVSAIQVESREGYVSADEHSKTQTQLDEAKETIGTLEAEGRESTKKIALMETAGAKVVADSIQDGILAESDLPEKIHAKTKKMVDVKDHLKEGETFTKESESGKAFAAAFQAEVDDWQKSLAGADGAILGGDGKNDSNASTEKDDIEQGKSLARKATGTCRSDEEGK